MDSLRGQRVYVAGATGMVGRAFIRRLTGADCEILTVPRAELDLCQQQPTFDWLRKNRPDIVIVAAARVGGILANSTEPARFAYDNQQIASNLIEGSRQAGVRRLLYLGSSCIYPREAPQPIPESALLTGPLEPTCAAYAFAKIMGITLCTTYNQDYGLDYISAMPTNLYGPFDNFDLKTSHVLPAIIRKVVDAARTGADTVELWGTGVPKREFMHVDDLADACVFLLERYSLPMPINVGTGRDIGIAELAEMVAGIVGWHGSFVYDPSKPDGAPRKLLDVSRLTELGWTARMPLDQGIRDTYRWYEHATRPAVVA